MRDAGNIRRLGASFVTCNWVNDIGSRTRRDDDRAVARNRLVKFRVTRMERPFSMPTSSFITLAIGARQLVVHEPFEMTMWSFDSSLSLMP